MTKMSVRSTTARRLYVGPSLAFGVVHDSFIPSLMGTRWYKKHNTQAALIAPFLSQMMSEPGWMEKFQQNLQQVIVSLTQTGSGHASRERIRWQEAGVGRERNVGRESNRTGSPPKTQLLWSY